MSPSNFAKLIDLLTDSHLFETQKAFSTSREITEAKVKIMALGAIRKSLIGLVAFQVYTIALSLAFISTLATSAFSFLSKINPLEFIPFQVSAGLLLVFLMPLLFVLNQRFLLKRTGIHQSLEKIQKTLKEKPEGLPSSVSGSDLEEKIEEIIDRKIQENKPKK